MRRYRPCKFFEALANVFRIPDLRKRVLFTLALLAVYRLGGHIPTPGINADRLEEFFSQNQGTLFGFFDLFSRRHLPPADDLRAGHHALHHGVDHPAVADRRRPTLEKLQKEGELGRRKITQWTRYLTVGSGADAVVRHRHRAAAAQGDFVINPGLGFILMTMLTLTTGTAFIMWLGEQITERGIGNGMSLIIFAGIVVGSAQRDRQHLYERVRDPRVERRCTLLIILRDDGGGGGLHRPGGTRRAPHPGAVRQARGGTPR